MKIEKVKVCPGTGKICKSERCKGCPDTVLTFMKYLVKK